VALLQHVKGLGALIALTYVLTLDHPHRFDHSRDGGCFLGLRPGPRNSGYSQPQLHISKEGDRYLGTLMVPPGIGANRAICSLHDQALSCRLSVKERIGSHSCDTVAPARGRWHTHVVQGLKHSGPKMDELAARRC
jgi:hypothetical protein